MSRSIERAQASVTSRGFLNLLRVGLGLGVFGLATYGYIALTGRALGPAGSAPVTMVWTLLNAIGIGLYVPVEQVLLRRGRTSLRDLWTDPPLRRLLAYIAASLGIVGVTIFILARTAVVSVVGGSAAVAGLLVSGMLGMAVLHVARGLLAANGRYWSYSALLAVDGLVRLGGAAVLLHLGVVQAAPYAALMTLAPACAVAAAAALARPGGRGPGAADERGGGGAIAARGTSLSALSASSLLFQILANASPIVVNLLARESPERTTGVFISATVIARVPLFLFTAVQSVFIPRLSELLRKNDERAFRAMLGRAMTVTGVIAVSGTAAIFLLGPWIVSVLFGTEFAVSRLDITLLAASGGLLMFAQLISQTLVAVEMDRSLAGAWTVGLLAFAAATQLPLAVTTAAALATCVGALAALLVLVDQLRRRLAMWTRVSTAAGK